MAHILVAEDERDIRELIKFTLTFAGHKITEAANGEEAVKLAKEVLPDLILTDVRMPKMTGYEACKAIKMEETTKHIPVVILSAKGQDEEIDQGRESGANDYILKPFDPAKLQSRVAEILEKMAAGLMSPPAAADKAQEPAKNENSNSAGEAAEKSDIKSENSTKP
jgi:two-component system alkaline phosphatase synthesis response regulator PhoP